MPRPKRIQSALSNSDTPLVSADLEMKVIGAWLTLPGWWQKRRGVLRPELFFTQHYHHLAVALAQYCEKYPSPIDLVHLTEYCAAHLGGSPNSWADYITQCAIHAPRNHEIADELLSRLVTYHNRRVLHEAAHQLQTIARNDTALPHDNIVQLDRVYQETRLRMLTDSNSLVLESPYDAYVTWASGNGKILPTGYSNLDRLMGGLIPGELVIVAARPSVGKTAFLLGVAINMAKRGIKTAFISLEMHPLMITARIISNVLTIPMGILRQRSLSSELTGEIGRRMREEFPVENLLVFNKIPSTYTSVASCIEEGLRRGVECFMIDYLQLITVGDDYWGSERRDLELGYITSQLKELAVTRDVAIIVASQLNRASEQRSDKRPMLADLRDSGNIEQDADIVLMLYRPELYGIERYKDGSSTENICEVIVAKHRNGEVGNCKLYMSNQSARFHAIEEEAAPPPSPRVSPSHASQTGELDKGKFLEKSDALFGEFKITDHSNAAPSPAKPAEHVQLAPREHSAHKPGQDRLHQSRGFPPVSKPSSPHAPQKGTRGRSPPQLPF